MQVDLILNTVAHNLNLHNGAVSQAIAQAAGQAIQFEVTRQHPSGLQDGEHATSTGGNLKCKEIFHAVLCGWNGDQGNAQQVR